MSAGSWLVPCVRGGERKRSGTKRRAYSRRVVKAHQVPNYSTELHVDLSFLILCYSITDFSCIIILFLSFHYYSVRFFVFYLCYIILQLIICPVFSFTVPLLHVH